MNFVYYNIQERIILWLAPVLSEIVKTYFYIRIMVIILVEKHVPSKINSEETLPLVHKKYVDIYFLEHFNRWVNLLCIIWYAPCSTFIVLKKKGRQKIPVYS